ncbi:MAG: cation diffusion facilitator family transporter [Acidiferrobacterales bacterium]|nr:cation diffusion facilitator family transporter [Acidiferrobacterales bacterium]
MVGCTDCAPDVSDTHNNPTFRRVLWFALIVNFGMFVVEIVASYFGDSVSLQADALDFFGDAANYAISLFVLGMALNLRARASLFKGITMGAFGIWVLVNAGYRAYVGSEPEPSVMGTIALLALVANVSVAVTLYRYREGDSNMRSIWLCSRNDAIGNIAVIVAAAGVFVSTSRWPDLVVAGLIASLSLSAAYQIIRLSITEIKTGSTIDVAR